MLQSWLTRLLATSGRAAAVTPPALRGADSLALVREQIERDVAGGFDTPQEIVEGAIECWADEIDRAVLECEVPRFTAQALARHAAAQAAWPVLTDCDRLDAAFEALEDDGVVARQHFSCCGTCGVAEIANEMAGFEAATGRPARGYVFYHVQDTESAAEGEGLYLNYGAANGTERDSVAIGRVVADRLRTHGLDVDWGGDLGKRIGVRLDWKRRRT